jgi:lipopolysaccharide biosynthesis regulator YciM
MIDNLLAWLLLPLGVVLGWVLSRRRTPDDVQAAGSVPPSVGGLLTQLSADDPDQAIAALTQVSELDPATAELHLTLGNLFRKRGEVDRALRIHEALLARSQLKPELMQRARFELGQDYAKAGLIDHAESLFQDLVSQGLSVIPSLEQLAALYEQGRDWRHAIETMQRLEAARGESRRSIIAHYTCEIADEARRDGNPAQAFKQARKALDLDPQCVRASLLMGALQEAEQDFIGAAVSYRRAFDQDARFLPEVLAPLQRCVEKTGKDEMFTTFLSDAKQMSSSMLPVVEEARRMQQEGLDALNHLSASLEQRPTRTVLMEFLDLLEKKPEVIAAGLDKPAASLRRAIARAVEANPRYLCGNCGFNPRQLFWQCPTCKQWGSVVPVDDLQNSGA